MLPHQQPAHVGEEEPPLSVVGVRVGLGELVVDAVVPGPLENVVLRGREGRRWNRFMRVGGSQSTVTNSFHPLLRGKKF